MSSIYRHTVRTQVQGVLNIQTYGLDTGKGVLNIQTYSLNTDSGCPKYIDILSGHKYWVS